VRARHRDARRLEASRFAEQLEPLGFPDEPVSVVRLPAARQSLVGRLSAAVVGPARGVARLDAHLEARAEVRLELGRRGRAGLLHEQQVAVEPLDRLGGKRSADRPRAVGALVRVVINADVVTADAEHGVVRRDRPRPLRV
jgi:hypothetical protein